MFADDAVGDPSPAAHELVSVDLLAKEDAVILLQDRSMLTHPCKALPPFGVTDADRRETELSVVE
jgi:hypothetical protein